MLALGRVCSGRRCCDQPLRQAAGFELSKWSMADVMVLAIFMSFVAFNWRDRQRVRRLTQRANVQQC